MMIESLKKLTRNSGQSNYIPNGYKVCNGQEVPDWTLVQIKGDCIRLIRPFGYSDDIINSYWSWSRCLEQS